MALTFPSDPAASFFCCCCYWFLSLLFHKATHPRPPRRPTARPGPAAPAETAPPARRAGQGGGRGLHLLHSAGAGFQSPPGSGGEAVREGRSVRGGAGPARARPTREPPVLPRAGPGSPRHCGALAPPLPRLREATRTAPVPTHASKLPFGSHCFYLSLIFLPTFSRTLGSPNHHPSLH